MATDDIERIKSNLDKMISKGAPEADLDLYLKSEGYQSVDAWKAAAGASGGTAGERLSGIASDIAAAPGVAYDVARTWSNRALGGMMGLPRLALEGIDWLGRKDVEGGGTGAHIPQSVSEVLPTAEQATKWLNRPSSGRGIFTHTAEPRPEVTTGIPLIDAIGEGLISLPFTGGIGALAPGITKATLPVAARTSASLPAVLSTIAAPMVSEGAARIPGIKDTALEPWARVLGAFGGAGFGAALPSAGRKVRDIGASLAAPFTETGREGIVSRALVKEASDPSTAISRLEAQTLPSQVPSANIPGFSVDAGKASRDPGLMALSDIVPDAIKGPTAQANNAVLTQALNALDAGMDPRQFVAALERVDTGAAMRAQQALNALPPGADAATAGLAVRQALRGRYEALDTARSTATTPLYEAARTSPVPIDPSDPLGFVQGVAKTAKGDRLSLMKTVENYLTSGAKTSAEMMEVRTAIADLLDNPNLPRSQQALLTEAKKRVEASLAVVPEEQQARQTFAAMSKPLDVFDASKGAPNVARVIEQNPYSKQPILPAEAVPAQFFRPGDIGGASMKEFLAANAGNTGAIDAMRNFIATKARESGDPRAFLAKNRTAIETLDPALARQLEDAAATSAISTGFQAGPASKFLGGQDIDAAVKTTLGSPDSQNRLKALQMTVGSDPAAVAGMQKAILDDFRARAEMKVSQGATVGEPRLGANGAATWLKDNRAAVANVLTPDQLQGLETITAALTTAAQTVPGRVGSQTYSRLATDNILGALISPKYANAPGLEVLRKPLGLIYGGKEGGANAAIMEKLFEALQNPALAAALMKKATASNVKMAEPLLRNVLLRGAAVPALEAIP